MARQLRSRGKEVPLLTLFDTTQPRVLALLPGVAEVPDPVPTCGWKRCSTTCGRPGGSRSRQAWRYFRERMKKFRLPVPKGGTGEGSARGGGRMSRGGSSIARCSTTGPSRVTRRCCSSAPRPFRGAGSATPSSGGERSRAADSPSTRCRANMRRCFWSPHVQRLAALWKECAQRVRAASGGASPGPGRVEASRSAPASRRSPVHTWAPCEHRRNPACRSWREICNLLIDNSD